MRPNTDELAEEFAVSEKTVRNAGKIAEVIEQADPETKQEFETGQLSQKIAE